LYDVDKPLLSVGHDLALSMWGVGRIGRA
jgi:hypothetical protein